MLDIPHDYSVSPDDDQNISPESYSIREHDSLAKARALEAELEEALESCDEDDVAPTETVAAKAKMLLQDLQAFEEPLISCLPGGEIGFQWMLDGELIISFSIYADDFITYSVLVKRTGERHTGSIPFVRAKLPEEIDRHLRKYFYRKDSAWIEKSPTLSQ